MCGGFIHLKLLQLQGGSRFTSTWHIDQQMMDPSINRSVTLNYFDLFFHVVHIPPSLAGFVSRYSFIPNGAAELGGGGFVFYLHVFVVFILEIKVPRRGTRISAGA